MTTPPLDLPALKARVESIPPKGESAMKGMAFPATALPELWTLRHIARVDAPALLEYAEANRKGWGELLNDYARMETRAEAAEKAVEAVRELHKAVWHEATNLDGTPWAGWICDHCTGTGHISVLTLHPCPTITALDGTP